jgi:hypothetical protein
MRSGCAHQEKEQMISEKKRYPKTLMQKRKTAIIALVVAVALLIPAMIFISAIVRTYPYYDTDGTKYLLKYRSGEYALYDEDGYKQDAYADTQKIAESLVDKGWVKLPKDRVVLSKEEYNRTLEKFRKEIITLSQELVNSRKETPEEILNELYCTPKEQVENKIKELARFIGVEIKE